MTESLSTPALVVDLDVFEANVEAMSEMLHGTGKTVRPHFKTHRTPELARRELGGPIVGATCATVGEAEAAVAAGIDDVLIANEVVDPPKMARIAQLARTAKVIVAADDAGPVAELSRAARAAGVTVGVVVDVDVMLHRCGVPSAADAVALARVISASPGLRLAGVMGYEGRVRLTVEDRDAKLAAAYRTLGDAKAAIEAAGFPVEIVSGAGTSTVREALADPHITEVQAGVFSLMEPELLVMDLPFRCAVAVRATVISRHPGRFVANAGRRVIGIDHGPPIPVGFAGAEVAMSDEHATVRIAGEPPALGSTVDFIPGQIRTTFNLHDRVWVSRGGEIVDCWPVTARGASQ
ncbi:MAG TPA: alanine racemase [Candidatus Dormibacteraeota bacterium]|nr:alanine racemase [Candidatus Dormibacteraeota bacterium]